MCLNVFIKFLSNSFHIFTTHNYSSFWGVSNSHVPWSLRTLVSSWGTFIPNPFSHSALLSPCRISFVYLKTEAETNLSPLNVHLHGNSFIQSEQRLFYFIQATFLRHPFPLVFSLSLVILIISKFLLDNWHPYLCIIPAFSNFFFGNYLCARACSETFICFWEICNIRYKHGPSISKDSMQGCGDALVMHLFP